MKVFKVRFDDTCRRKNIDTSMHKKKEVERFNVANDPSKYHRCHLLSLRGRISSPTIKIIKNQVNFNLVMVLRHR